MKPILEIQNVSKKFRIQHENLKYLSLRDAIISKFQKQDNLSEEFYALKDVSFNLEQGDTLGIIGKNGAGKSTLLKILSKITPPSSGKIICRGRIASLLEVGTGFHLELSGRENVFMNGSILGMRKAEIKKNFDAIIDFAGVEKFIDTPLKHYSSGMQLRLAFAVAAFLENEILIIDEVLAVGDAEFQKKCMGKMDDVSKSGRTILFVSHNLNALLSLCKKAIYLKNGELVSMGDSLTITENYLLSETNLTTNIKYSNDKRPGDKNAKLNSIRIIDKKLNPLESSNIGQSIGVEFIYEILNDGFNPIPNLHVLNHRGEVAFFGIEKSAANINNKGTYKTIMWIPENTLNTGKYFFEPALSTLNPLTIHFYEKESVMIEMFENIDDRKTIFKDPIPGIVRPETIWETIKN